MYMIVSAIFGIYTIIGMVYWTSMELGGHSMSNRRPVLGPVTTLEGSLLQTVEEFTRKNGLDISTYERWSDGRPQMDIAHAPMVFDVAPRKEGSPSGYAINISTPKGFINLPVGGRVWISHRTGRITSISSTMPLQTLTFEEAIALARQIEDQITALGVEANFAHHDITEEEFLEKWRRSKNNNSYAAWGIENKVKLRIKPFSGYSQVAFTTPIGIPREGPETYLVEFTMGLHEAAREEVRELTYARRLAINGNEEEELPISIWFDMPNWRPEGWQGKWIK